jgi:hypothetical protein
MSDRRAGEVLLAVAKRRNEDRDHVQAEVEVFTEAAAADLGLEILVGCREDARVHLDAAPCRRPPPSSAPAGRGAPWPGVFRLMSPIFVEEDRAAVGDLELAAAVGHSASERAAHVPEQLAFDQLLGIAAQLTSTNAAARRRLSA